MRTALWLLACAGAVTACVQALGDDFEIGATAASSSAAATTNASSSSASSGTGGAGPCELGTTQGCEPGEKCSVIDPDSFAVGCVPAGSKGPTELCASDSECDVGLFCDGATGVCESICTEPGTQSTCGFGWCVVTPLAGYGLCTVGCSPSNPAMCGSAELTCAWWGPTENGESTFHCALPAQDGGGNMLGDACTKLMDLPILHSCAPGLVCVNAMPSTMGTCFRWCSPPGDQAQCQGTEVCTGFPTPIVQAGIQYGLCL